jgi:hypothetical protein
VSSNIRADTFAVSAVVPAYNSAEWLPSTLDSLAVALARTPWRAEIVIVDDGSSDDTIAILTAMQETYPYPIRIVEQPNKGVFMAVWAGLRAARFDEVLIVNSRLLFRADSLEYLSGAIAADSEARSWNGHVATDPTAPLIGRFWEVPTYVFWGSYLARPRKTLITPDNFDSVPKGTGCFLVRRDLFLDAYDVCWPEANSRFTSDDTKLLRYVAGQSPIRLDPGFFATYRPRTTFSKFLSHSRGRGTMFVDSYAGTSKLKNAALIALGILPPIALGVLTALSVTTQWSAIAVVLGIGVLALLTPMAIAATRNCPGRALASYLLYILPFGVTFWSGLVRGLVLHRRAFTRRNETAQEI